MDVLHSIWFWVFFMCLICVDICRKLILHILSHSWNLSMIILPVLRPRISVDCLSNNLKNT